MNMHELVHTRLSLCITKAMPIDPAYSITQIAKLLKVAPDTLRRWERRKIIKPKRDAQNSRIYSLSDLATLKTYLENSKPKSFTIASAAKSLKVSPASLRRWEREGKISSLRTPGGHRRFSPSDLETIKKDVFTQPVPKIIPLPSVLLNTQYPIPNTALPTEEPTPFAGNPLTLLKTPIADSPILSPDFPPNAQYSIPNTKQKPKSRPGWFAYTAIIVLILLLIGGGFGFSRLLSPTSTDPRSQASTTINQEGSPSSFPTVGNDSDIGYFLNGTITIGTDTGELSHLDQFGNMYAS